MVDEKSKMARYGEIEQTVVHMLRDYFPGGLNFDLDADLVKDLKLDSDDATEMLMRLMKHFDVRIPQAEWDKALPPSVRRISEIVASAVEAKA